VPRCTVAAAQPTATNHAMRFVNARSR
jgi:hypothetical protein